MRCRDWLRRTAVGILAPMPVIDMHTHAFPDDLAQRAIASLEASANWKAVADGTISSLVESMDAAGVDISVVCPIATSARQTKGVFKWCKAIRGERIEPFPSVHPDTPEAGKWVHKIAKANFVGIKLHPMYQDFFPDEPRMDEIYAAATECGLTVALHCGFDISYPADARARPDRVAQVVRRHPAMQLICTHLGGWKDWDQARRHLVGSDVYLETSFSLERLGAAESAKIIRDHGVERVLFGTDWPWVAQDHEIALVKALGLDEKETGQILWSNASRLLGW